MAEIWRYSVSEHYPRVINFLVATDHQTGYTFHTLMEGGRTTFIVAQATQKPIEFCKQHQLVVGRGDTFRQRGCPSGTLGSRWVHISTGISGHHEVTVERKVETIRKAIKTLLVSIPYRIPAVWYRFMMDYVIRMLNHTPNRKSIQHPSQQGTPYRIFEGLKLGTTIPLNLDELTVKFGDVVTTNSLTKDGQAPSRR